MHRWTLALEFRAALRVRLAGHTDSKTHRGYTHHELAALRFAIEKLPSLNA